MQWKSNRIPSRLADEPCQTNWRRASTCVCKCACSSTIGYHWLHSKSFNAETISRLIHSLNNWEKRGNQCNDSFDFKRTMKSAYPVVTPIFTFFKLCFGLHQLLREISGSVAPACSTEFTIQVIKSVSLHVWCWALKNRCLMESKNYSVKAVRVNPHSKVTGLWDQNNELKNTTQRTAAGIFGIRWRFTIKNIFAVIIWFVKWRI